jgi:hypothetical protein
MFKRVQTVMEAPSWRLQLLISSVVIACGFVWLNTWNVLPCDDCMIRRGRPFAFRITEGFATEPQTLWAGLAVDIAIVITAIFLLFTLLRFVSKRPASRRA